METRDARAVTAAVGGGVILVVDDEDMVRRAAKVSLEKYGYQVVLAEDGKRAVDVLTSLDHTISGVLLDMTMPGMSGEQTFQQMRRIRPDLPVIASSGFSEAEAIARFGLGISGFVQKPYTAAALAAKVAEVMADRRSGDLTGSGGERA
jgi:CheY-like chemotaxis protein